MLINRKMARTGGGSVFVTYLGILAFFGKLQIEAQPCSSYASSQVLRMCESGEIRGQSVYLDTSAYNGLPASCTCRMEATGAGSRVVFDPVVVDSTNCGTSVLLYDYAFVSNCSSRGKPSTFLSIGVSMDVIVRGRDTVDTCINLLAENPATSLRVTCYESVTVTSSTSSTSTTTRLPPTTITTSSSISTQTPVIRACQAIGLPVLDMCKSSSATGGRLYVDSSFFTDQYLSCTCSVQAVSQFGGTVAVYPQNVDNSNCNTNVYIDDLSFYIGCRSNSFVEKFLSPSASLDMTIRGEGIARHCLMLESSDSLLQLSCSGGRTNATSTTSTTTTMTTTTTAATTTSTSTSTSTSTTTSTTETSIQSSTMPSTSSVTPSTTTASASTTEASTEATTETSSSASTTSSKETTTSTSPSPGSTTQSTSPTAVSTPSSSSSSSGSTPFSSSTSSSTTSTTMKPKPDGQSGFSVTGLIIGLVVLFVVIVVVIVCCICYRRKNKDEPADDQEKFSSFKTPETVPEGMLEVGSRSVDNPLYFEGDSYSSFPKHQRPEITESKVVSPFDIERLYEIIAQKEFVNHTDIM